METLAVLSMHTSPLAQAGTGDSGGMNVYIRELCAALARRGVRCEVFTRAEDPTLPPTVAVEPGFVVHHVPAGPIGPVAKEDLLALVPTWTDGVAAVLDRLEAQGRRIDAIHANYWLSGVAGHRLKHQRDVPLISTFHTLDRVKADAGPEDRELSLVRQTSEMETVGCSDLLLASCDVEADQLVELYGAERDRIEVVAPGVNHAIFGPGDRVQARRAIGWPQDVPLVLFVGRIQPLKGPSVAVEALGLLRTRTSDRLQRASLMVIGGPSGPQGAGELSALERSVAAYGLKDRVTCVPPQRHELLSTSYRAADVVIVPSRSESFGLVALEASACGIPVVASAVGGLTTLVDHGRTGFLVEGRDPSQFAHHLGTLIGHPEIAATMGHAAGRRARAYTWTVAASRLEHRVVQITSRQLVACR